MTAPGFCRDVSESTKTLRRLAADVAEVIPAVDATAVHDRWDPGIGPFEEERKLEMILAELAERGTVPDHVETEAPYPTSQRRCDLVVEPSEQRLPVEAKLLRFRRDNGNIDPNMYKSVFSPFPERSSSSLLTDARKLVDSELDGPYGLLGLYYERDEEPYDELRADRIAEKFAMDGAYWYDFDVELAAVERFDGLRHPHHQHGR